MATLNASTTAEDKLAVITRSLYAGKYGEGIGDYGSWDEVSETVIAKVIYRTPGVSGWQQERWWTHCGDAAACHSEVYWWDCRDT